MTNNRIIDASNKNKVKLKNPDYIYKAYKLFTDYVFYTKK